MIRALSCQIQDKTGGCRTKRGPGCAWRTTQSIKRTQVANQSRTSCKRPLSFKLSNRGIDDEGTEDRPSVNPSDSLLDDYIFLRGNDRG